MRVPIILGTARANRMSEHVANFLLVKAKEAGFDSEIIDVRDYRLEATDNSGNPEPAKKWADIVAGADGLIFVTPEYNHSYPGELKMMLDMLYKEYAGKKAAVCGVSAGNFGGARVVELMNLLLVTLGISPAQYSMNVVNVNQVFDESGNLIDDSYDKKAEQFLASFKKFIS